MSHYTRHRSYPHTSATMLHFKGVENPVKLSIPYLSLFISICNVLTRHKVCASLII